MARVQAVNNSCATGHEAVADARCSFLTRFSGCHEVSLETVNVAVGGGNHEAALADGGGGQHLAADAVPAQFGPLRQVEDVQVAVARADIDPAADHHGRAVHLLAGAEAPD